MGGASDPLCLSSRARRTALLSESGETPLLLFLLPPLSLAPCRLPLFSEESPCSMNTTRDENGGWIFDLLRLASRAGRTALLSESGETPLLRSAPAPFLFFSYHFSLFSCPLPLFSEEAG